MGHSHAHGTPADVPIRRAVRTVLLGILAVIAAATVVGLVVFWPSHTPHPSGDSSYAAPGVTFPNATVTSVGKPCSKAYASGTDCGKVGVRIDEGADKGTTARHPRGRRPRIRRTRAGEVHAARAAHR